MECRGEGTRSAVITRRHCRVFNSSHEKKVVKNETKNGGGGEPFNRPTTEEAADACNTPCASKDSLRAVGRAHNVDVIVVSQKKGSTLLVLSPVSISNIKLCFLREHRTHKF